MALPLTPLFCLFGCPSDCRNFVAEGQRTRAGSDTAQPQILDEGAIAVSVAVASAPATWRLLNSMKAAVSSIDGPGRPGWMAQVRGDGNEGFAPMLAL